MAEAKRGLSVRADSVPFSGNDLQPIRSITPSRFPPPSDVFLLPEAFNGLYSRTHHYSTKAALLQKCSKEILYAQIVVDH